MNRTQIYLTDAIDEALQRLSRQTGRTKSRLIRDALAEAYLGAADPERVLDALRASAGSWRRKQTGARFVERRRRGLGRRLGKGRAR